MRTWVSLAGEKARQLRNDAEQSDHDHREDEAIWRPLDELDQLTSRGSTVTEPDGHLSGLRDWWFGTRIEDTWMKLHSVEESVDATRRDVETAVRHARDHTASDGEDTKRLNKDLAEAPTGADQQSVAVDALRRAHQKSHQKHIDERQRNRAMVVFAATLVTGAVAAVIAQAYAFGTTPLLEKPKDPATGVVADIGSTTLLLLVLGFGALGGLISALVSLYLTAKSVDDTMWFDPRPTMVAIKGSLGAWTGFLGVLMVGTGLVVGVYTSVPSAIILAFLFGYGQQAVTGVLLDKNVAKLSDPSKS
jgi:hypothetical protein